MKEALLRQMYNAISIGNDNYDKFIYHLTEQTKEIDFTNKKILEIGCGRGFVSLYLSLFKNVQFIDALDESLGEGHEVDVVDYLSDAIKKININNIHVLKMDIMQYQAPRKYDIIISNNAMHHICEHGLLRMDTRAREKYYAIFKHVRTLLKDNGFLLMHEYSRRSIWRYLPSKTFKEITWSMHPTMSEWIDVMRKSGFNNISYKYAIAYPLRKFKDFLQFSWIHFFYYPAFYLKSQA